MNRYPQTRQSRNRFAIVFAAWGWSGLLLLPLSLAGCRTETKTDDSKTEPVTSNKSSKTETDSTKPKDARKPPVKKPKTPVNSKKPPVVAKKDSPKKKKEEAKLTPEQKTEIDRLIERKKAIHDLEEIGAEVKKNNLEEVVRVDFADAEEVTDKHFALLRNFPYLRFVNASFHKKVSDAGIKHLEGAEFMTELYLRGTQISNVSLKTIGKLERLQSLCVDGTKISDEGLIHLQGLPEIRKLHIRSRNKISDAGLKPIYKLKSLRELKIGGTQITSKGVKQLETILPNCDVNTVPLPKQP